MHLKDLFSKQCILGTIGVCMVGFGSLFTACWMDFFESMLAKEMHLGPNTKSFEIWKRPPLPMALDIYFFNWTNPSNFTKDEFRKPVLEELGPYRFTELMDKVDVDWHPDNSTVSFRKKSTFHFDAAGSKGRLEDTITSLNIIALSAAATAINYNYINQKKVSVGLSMYDQQVYITKLARELLFEGYQDDMIDIAREMPSFLVGEKITVPYDRFGWFYMRNETSNQTGHYNMNTGADDLSQIGRVEQWNYADRTNFFPRQCGMINGSAGEFYPPNQTKDRPVHLFSPDMCRSVAFDFECERQIHGITGYKYSGGRKTVDNGTEFPENLCFSEGESVPSGVMNISSCRYGTPVFMSFPHFYAADPYYLDQVEGLNPSQEKHEFSITLEPMTGIPLDVAARFQLNMLVRPVANIALYHEAPTLFFPILWFEQRVTMNEEMADEIRMVLTIPKIGYISCGVIIALGVIMILWLPVARLCCGGRSRKGSASAGEKAEMKAKGKVGHDLQLPEGSPLLQQKNGQWRGPSEQQDVVKMNLSPNGIDTTPRTNAVVEAL